MTGRDERLNAAAAAIGARDWARAEIECRAVLDDTPHDPTALNLLGMTAFGLNQLERAVEFIEAAASVNDAEPSYHRNLCELYRLAGRLPQAIAHGERAAELAPENKEVHHRLSVAYQAGLNFSAAEACARRAIDLDPDYAQAHFHLADLLLLQGQFDEGGAEFEWRWLVDNAPPEVARLPQPGWRGEILDGQTLLVHGTEGLGDTLQFARYIPLAAARCERLVLACQPALAPFLADLPGVDATVTDWQSLPEFDRHCAVASLPFMLGASVETILPPLAFIQADPVLVELWRARIATRLPAGYRRIGIVWAGSTAHPNNAQRSMPLAAFTPVAALDGIGLISLQKGEAAEQTRTYPGRAPMIDRTHELYTLSDTIALIQTLDLVIAVDTMVAHLAATMGKPVWLLLPHVPDWRWLLDRDDTPWYPTMRLFRQTARDDWGGVMRRVADALAAW